MSVDEDKRKGSLADMNDSLQIPGRCEVSRVLQGAQQSLVVRK